MDFDKRYARLLERRAPADDRLVKAMRSESFEFAEATGMLKYLLGAMRAIAETYTGRLIEQGNRVEKQLSKRLRAPELDIEFRRQGSVSNDTHIRHHSDVDVLVLCGKFISLEHPQVPSVPYQGNPVEDLLELRTDCRRHLGDAFPEADVDNAGSTALSISGGSLACKVDVVPANWLNTNLYVRTWAEENRGVQVIDKNTRVRSKNFPFLFNHRINHADAQRAGRLRMYIRLLKTLRADVEEGTIEFSSYDICSIVYRMPDHYWAIPLDRPVALALKLWTWLKAVCDSSTMRDELLVVDESRKIFDTESKLAQFQRLSKELMDLVYELLQEEEVELISEAHLR